MLANKNAAKLNGMKIYHSMSHQRGALSMDERNNSTYKEKKCRTIQYQCYKSKNQS